MRRSRAISSRSSAPILTRASPTSTILYRLSCPVTALELSVVGPYLPLGYLTVCPRVLVDAKQPVKLGGMQRPELAGRHSPSAATYRRAREAERFDDDGATACGFPPSATVSSARGVGIVCGGTISISRPTMEF